MVSLELCCKFQVSSEESQVRGGASPAGSVLADAPLFFSFLFFSLLLNKVMNQISSHMTNRVSSFTTHLYCLQLKHGPAPFNGSPSLTVTGVEANVPASVLFVMFPSQRSNAMFDLTKEKTPV